ncbi:MAG: M56 family metallopeptidase [Prosthecobacter sp.]
MNTLLDTWLISGWSYPVLAFLIVCALKTSGLVLLAWALTLFVKNKTAALRSWVWRLCVVALASLLLWPFAPSFLEHLRPRLPVRGNGALNIIQKARALDMLSKDNPPPGPARLHENPSRAAFSLEERPPVALAPLRTLWMARMERAVFLVWWAVAVLIFGMRLLRSACGRWWLQRHSRSLPQVNGCRLVAGPGSPVITGWWKAQIWLPAEAAAWSQAKVRAVSLHEMAHHQRHDGAWQWLGWLTASVWWWNPLSWLALRRMAAEAELAADERALQEGVAAPDYAQVLVEIAAGGRTGAQAAGVPMLGRSSIERRVQAILRGGGARSRFGKMARVVLVLAGAAAVVAAGVESRYAMMPAPADPLSKEERELVERCLDPLEKTAESLGRIHLTLKRAWSVTDKTGREIVRSPQPELVEAWVDETARKSRAEWRPGVSRWTGGAAAWVIENRTDVSDGQRSWSVDDDDTGVKFQQTNWHFFSPFAQNRAQGLLSALREMRRSGFKSFANSGHEIREAEVAGQKVLRVERKDFLVQQGKVMEIWDLSAADGSLVRHGFNLDASGGFAEEWKALAWAALPDGSQYPAKWEWRHTDSKETTTNQWEVTSLERIAAVPEALLLPPGRPQRPYVATDGSTAHAEALEARFVNARDGKTLDAVTVHYDINGSGRQAASSDASGVLRIPLPAGEIKSLHVWGMKAGYVTQRVHWSRYGDPLKIPQAYEVKLHPAGAPIGGIVVDGNDQPVVGAEVNIWHTGGPKRWDVFADIHSNIDRIAKTDAAGKWSLSGFAEDLTGLSIHITHPRHKRLAMDYLTATGQPYASLRDGSSKATLRGENIELTGTVTDEGGRPVTRCAITVGEDRWGSMDEPNTKVAADGSFKVHLHEKKKQWITFEAEGLQPHMQQINVSQESPAPLQVRLAAGRHLRVRVVDEAGAPVPGARVVANRWQQKRSLWFEVSTDAEGRFQWTGAPADEVKWDILSGRDAALRDFPLVADGQEQTVVLRPAVRFTGIVVDARTGSPLPQFSITPGDTRTHDVYWNDTDRRSFKNGAFTFDVWWMREPAALRVEAEGYEPFITPTFTPRQQTETLTVKLVPR